jgi:virginiamycin B lyase
VFDPVSKAWDRVVALPSGYGQPLFVAVAPDGRVWFTMPNTDSIGVYYPRTRSLAQWSVPTANAGPWDLAIDALGRVWFTEHFTNQIGSFDPAAQVFHEVSTTAPNSYPYGIAIDQSDDIWFTENNDAVAKIAEYTNRGVLNEYKIRATATAGSGLTPHLITIDPEGNIWWSEGWVHAIGTLNPSMAVPGTNRGVTEYFYSPSCSGCGTHTSGISAGRDGLIWLDDSLQNQFGSFSPRNRSFSFFASPGNHPHDGLNVDAQGRIWFDEEFSNDIAEASPAGCTTKTWWNWQWCQQQGQQ